MFLPSWNKRMTNSYASLCRKFPHVCEFLVQTKSFSLVWITNAFNLEWLLNLWERGKPQNKPSKKGLWRNWKMPNLKTREEVGKHISKCRRWFTKVDAIRPFIRASPTHIAHTQISWASWNCRDKWSLNTSLRLFFFFWWGLLHGPQQGPDRMKEKT